MIGAEFPMPSPPRKHRLSPEQLRPLQLLASSRHGANEELLVLGHGFSRRMLAGIVRRKLAAAEREVAKAGGKTIEVVRAKQDSAGWPTDGQPKQLSPT